MNQELGQFQERLQRCFGVCRDKAASVLQDDDKNMPAAQARAEEPLHPRPAASVRRRELSCRDASSLCAHGGVSRTLSFCPSPPSESDGRVRGGLLET